MLNRITPDDGPVWEGFVQALIAEGLPTDDLLAEGQRFFQLDDAGAFAGFQLAGQDVLLRSAVVPAQFRGRGIGRRLAGALLDQAWALGAKRAWILTTTATPFARSLGFLPVDRSLAPPAISRTAQFRGLCPASATLLALDL